MRILFINGSPNHHGNTAALAAVLLKGKEYKTLNLTDYTIGAYGQNLPGDGLNEVIAAMKEADTVVIGSPVYWHNICGSVRNVLDRFYGKVALVEGTSAEHIAAGTTAEKEAERAEREMVEDAADENLMPEDDDEDDKDEDDEAADAAKRQKIAIAIAVVAVIIAAVLGFFIGSGGFSHKGADSASLTSDQLDTVVASYSYNGKSVDVTAREAIESQYSLDSVKQSDGTYPTPSADIVLSYARNHILLNEAEARGISVTDKEMKEYAENALGMSDYSQMSQQYGVTEDQAKTIVKQQATMQKLYDKIVGTSSATMPEAPAQPEDGNEDTASKDYADYIIKLAGDEWDVKKGTWASTDGVYAKALAGQEFTADSATYGQALTAYYTAYQQYAQASSESGSKWTEFVNGLYAKANITLYGLYQ